MAHLLRYYPPLHEVVAIYSSPHALLRPTMLRFPIEQMDQYADELHGGFSLYVPPAFGSPIQNWELLSKLYSVEHLRTITRV